MKLRSLAAVAIMLGLFVGGVWMMQYRPERLSGDGIISDSGFWSYPRYTISFPPIDIAHDTVARFRIAGLPRAPMTFSLRVAVPDRTDETAPMRRTDDLLLAVRIYDDRGRELYGAEEPLPQWHVSQSGGNASLWHPDLRELSFRPGREYTIEIRSSGSKSGTYQLEPRLTGGGHELP